MKDTNETWAGQVYQHYQHKCSNCGGNNRLHPRLIVPQEKGGRQTVENSTLLCFSCDNASGLGGLGGGDNDRMVDFHLSRRLFDLMHSWQDRNLFTTMSAGIRRLMGMFLEKPQRFADLARYQDDDPAGPKINFWVNREFYETFQKQVRDDFGLTVKDALIALVLLHEESLEDKS